MRLRTIVDFAFLILAIVLTSVLLSGSYDREALKTQSLEIQELRKEFRDVMNHNMDYIEGRVNRIGQAQDRYQVGMTSRVDVLENRMKSLDARTGNSGRIINNNSAIANGTPVAPRNENIKELQ